MLQKLGSMHLFQCQPIESNAVLNRILDFMITKKAYGEEIKRHCIKLYFVMWQTISIDTITLH